MKISELAKAKKIFEQLLAINISQTVEAFRKNTGYSPRKIHVDMMNVTEYGDEISVLVVNKVWVELDIF